MFRLKWNVHNGYLSRRRALPLCCRWLQTSGRQQCCWNPIIASSGFALTWNKRNSGKLYLYKGTVYFIFYSDADNCGYATSFSVLLSLGTSNMREQGISVMESCHMMLIIFSCLRLLLDSIICGYNWEFLFADNKVFEKNSEMVAMRAEIGKN